MGVQIDPDDKEMRDLINSVTEALEAERDAYRGHVVDEPSMYKYSCTHDELMKARRRVGVAYERLGRLFYASL